MYIGLWDATFQLRHKKHLCLFKDSLSFFLCIFLVPGFPFAPVQVSWTEMLAIIKKKFVVKRIRERISSNLGSRRLSTRSHLFKGVIYHQNLLSYPVVSVFHLLNNWGQVAGRSPRVSWARRSINAKLENNTTYKITFAASHSFFQYYLGHFLW